MIANNFSTKKLVDTKIKGRANINRTIVNISIFRILAGSASSPRLEGEDIGQAAQFVLELLTVFLRGAEVYAYDAGLLPDLRVEDLAQ